MLRLPLIPLRGLIIFPNMVLYFDVSRKKSIAALENAMLKDQKIFLTTQANAEIEDPTNEEFFHIGVIAKIKQMLKMQGGIVRVLVEGETRASIKSFTQEESFIEADVEIKEDIFTRGEQREKALVRLIKDTFEKYSEISSKISREVAVDIANIDVPGRFADLISHHLDLSIIQKQKLIDAINVEKRLETLYFYLLEEVEIAQVEREIAIKVTNEMNKMQREHFLRSQIKVIQKELGDTDDIQEETEEMLEKLNKLKLKKSITEKVEKEIKKYERLHPATAESAVSRNYIESILDLPWNKQTKEQIDIAKAREVLDKDHYSLTKVKERILEYLAVRKLTGSIKGPIICLVGPPGVGKTSIARSIAESINRKFIRMSLGGVRDEAEIRGHRRTYVGATPGRIMTHIREIKSKNPLFLFDEIDKIGNDFRGDPASALLEVLDPEQNKEFMDHYYEVPFDLRKVMFVTTANTTSTIARPLLDRMEVIEVSGYTSLEKEEIAKRHLIPKQIKENGLEGMNINISKDALITIIENYTRESGVRELERKIGNVCRKLAAIAVEENKKTFSVRKNTISKLIGPPDYRMEERDKKDKCGIVTGLAWTRVGGETLEIEVNIMKGKGSLQLTGKLGDVMKESAKAGLSYIRSTLKDEVDEKFFSTHDIHIHVPQGAIPKDGPSAGISIATAMYSAITKKKVKSSAAMTGEITLRGRVLAIGGLKEKLLAAKRFGIDIVIIPEENREDLEEIPAEIKKGIKIYPVSKMDEVLEKVLV